ARAGVGTILLEARTIAEAASGRNAGFLLAGVAENFVAACRRYGEQNALRIWRFTKRNQALVRAHVRENELACDLAWNGASQLAALRVEPVRGQMLATAPLARRVFERPAYANRGYRYWRQRADGRVLVGGWRDTAADEEIGEEERTTKRIQDQLDGFLREHAPDALVTHRWAGTMGFSHDALPYVG